MSSSLSARYFISENSYLSLLQIKICSQPTDKPECIISSQEKEDFLFSVLIKTSHCSFETFGYEELDYEELLE